MNTPNTDKANDRIKDAVKRLEGAVDDVVALGRQPRCPLLGERGRPAERRGAGAGARALLAPGTRLALVGQAPHAIAVPGCQRRKESSAFARASPTTTA